MAAKTKTAAPIIAAPVAGLVYVTGEFPAFGVHVETVTESTVTFKTVNDPKRGLMTVPVRKVKTKDKTVRTDRTEYVPREFPAGEAKLTKNEMGAAVALALRMYGDGAKNVRLYTMDGTFSVKIDSTITRKLKPAAKRKAA